jgi:hypothetical protein
MDLIEHLGYDPNRLLPAPRFIHLGPGRVTFHAITPPRLAYPGQGRFTTDPMDVGDLCRLFFGIDPTREIEKFREQMKAVDKWQKALYAAWVTGSSVGLHIDLDSPGGDLPGFYEVPTPEPTIPTEPRKQNGRSAAYLALDPTKNTRRGRTGRKFRTADNRSSRR